MTEEEILRMTALKELQWFVYGRDYTCNHKNLRLSIDKFKHNPSLYIENLENNGETTHFCNFYQLQDLIGSKMTELLKLILAANE